MFTRVEMVYTEGVEKKPHREMLGQLNSVLDNGKWVLELRPLEWIDPSTHGMWPPIAVLYAPTFGYLRHRTLCVQGYESIKKGSERRWTVQRWLCELHERDFVMRLKNPPKKLDEVPSIYATAKA